MLHGIQIDHEFYCKQNYILLILLVVNIFYYSFQLISH